jgi:sugar lactone lactonase YvrE
MRPLLRISAVIVLLLIVGCSSGLQNIRTEGQGPWTKAYVDNIGGLENISFDGQGSMFVSGFTGNVYRIEPTENPYRGKVTASRKLGIWCTGIEVGPDGYVYTAVTDDKQRYRIAKLDRRLESLEWLTGYIDGMNGFTQHEGYLYYTSSNLSFFFPKGRVFRSQFSSSESFRSPEVFLDNLKNVNGIKFSPDGMIFYYTDLLRGLNAYDIKTKKTSLVFGKGIMTIYDDFEITPEGDIWLCINSQGTIAFISKGKVGKAFHIGDLKTPSSCKLGSGPGFKKEFLYVTELSLKKSSTKFDGRGLWAVPLSELK